jgi:hypothetical protein
MATKEEAYQAAIKTLRYVRQNPLTKMVVTTDGIKCYNWGEPLEPTFVATIDNEPCWGLRFTSGKLAMTRYIYDPTNPESLKLKPFWDKGTQVGSVVIFCKQGKHHEAEMAARHQLNQFLQRELNRINTQQIQNAVQMAGIAKGGK